MSLADQQLELNKRLNEIIASQIKGMPQGLTDHTIMYGGVILGLILIYHHPEKYSDLTSMMINDMPLEVYHLMKQYSDYLFEEDILRKYEKN